MEWVDFEIIRANVHIEDFLAQVHGINPVKTHGKYLLYRSPFHEDRNPSFSVTRQDNRWYDHATDEKGSVIDLAMRLGHGNTPREAALFLQRVMAGGGEASYVRLPPRKAEQPTTTITKIVDIENRHLIRYLSVDRAIPVNIAKAYLKEVHYCSTTTQKEYYALGLRNRSDGYAIRNKLFKGNIGPADFSFFPGADNSECILFEGMFDFLSAVADNGPMSSDVIILNSVSNLAKALPVLSKYARVGCMLDNDDAGRKAYAKITDISETGDVVDLSGIYCQAKDYNEYYLKKKTKK